MITWTFVGQNISIGSQEKNFERDRIKWAATLGIDPETKIRIINGNFNDTLPSGVADSTLDSSNVSQSTVPVVPKKNRTGKTSQLPPVSNDVDNPGDSTDVLGLSDTGGYFDESSVWVYGE